NSCAGRGWQEFKQAIGAPDPEHYDPPLRSKPDAAPDGDGRQADSDAGPEQVATAADLIRINATTEWDWPGWIQSGVLNCLSSCEGHGKTRFAADLARRVYHGLPWPDGTPATLPKGSTTLWVPADNNHAELATLCRDFNIPPEALYLNASPKNPFGGTMLDSKEDLGALERRIELVRPALVIIDTMANATDRPMYRAEEAKKIFVPLQQI